MKSTLLRGGNLFLFLMAALFLASMQSALLFQFFGSFPGPALWIPCLVYIALFRGLSEAIVFAYLLALVLSPMTAISDGELMWVGAGLVLGTQILKGRIYWNTASYVMMVCGVGAFMFHVLHFITSYFVDDIPLLSLNLAEWVMEALLTALPAPILFMVFGWFDMVTHREDSTKAVAGIS